MSEAATAQEITITRVLEAPRELVWKAWTEPDHLVQWWGAGARGWSMLPSGVTMEVRPGGTFRVTLTNDRREPRWPRRGCTGRSWSRSGW
jgi:uncharacterized protein YndB with AHSA1/START domain